ncbi:aspartic peptidase domain-containing protein [Bisporella sp. PMI_857]|nr:aspartic peptidase domain-containing protein [Bisporella sp. PMI_857]
MTIKMPTHLRALLALASIAVAVADPVYFPLNYRYGGGSKVSTDIVLPWSNSTIEVVFDQGSENFWVFGPDAVMNWGKTCLFCQGQCNTTVTPYYDPSLSATASTEPFSFFNGYGAYTKIVQGDTSANDTLTFSSTSGQKSNVPVRVALVDYMQQRLSDGGQCIAAENYDRGILGTAPFQRSSTWNTTGPHVRQDLLESGVISAAVQSMWFDTAPSLINGTFTGGATFGGIDLSKYTGELVKLPLFTNDNTQGGASVGYYVAPPTVTVNGTVLDGSELTTRTCLIDSGTQIDDLPISTASLNDFLAAAGLVYSPVGRIAFPGACDDIPRDRTIDLEFAGLEEGKKVSIKIPLRNYARADGMEVGFCTLNIDVGGCLFGAPFATAAFFAADDEAGEVALAQGGVSEIGSGVDYDNVVVRIP